VFGDVSTGAQNDLQLATDMARDMVTRYAMSERIGLAAFEQSPRALPFAPAAPERKGYSERTARAIDAEITRLLGESHARVQETLTARRELLDALAHALLEQETVGRAALDALVKSHAAQRIRQAAPVKTGR
jgi:cell division protease FtsH